MLSFLFLFFPAAKCCTMFICQLLTVSFSCLELSMYRKVVIIWPLLLEGFVSFVNCYVGSYHFLHVISKPDYDIFLNLTKWFRHLTLNTLQLFHNINGAKPNM